MAENQNKPIGMLDWMTGIEDTDRLFYDALKAYKGGKSSQLPVKTDNRYLLFWDTCEPNTELNIKVNRRHNNLKFNFNN